MKTMFDNFACRTFGLLAGLVAFAVFGSTELRGQAICTELGPADVLILVNANSPVSRSVADLYRRYYPTITNDRVLYLSGTASFPAGLPDSASLTAGPADEIITRTQFNDLIAQPVREYLTSTGLVNTVYCLITTAGMPYRIEDTASNLADVVYPAGSNAGQTINSKNVVNAASVESDLAVLFQIDPQLTPGPTGPGVPLPNRVVNPYHGYSSGIKCWSALRDILARRATFRWSVNNLWPVEKQPRIEGLYDSSGCSAASNSRRMSPADIYLVTRLDGPRNQGEYPIFAVKNMLDRAAAVSNSLFNGFTGYNPGSSALVIDHTPQPTAELASSAAFNFPATVSHHTYQSNPIPPGKEAYPSGSGANCQRGGGKHYKILFSWLTGFTATLGVTESRPITAGLAGTVLWDDTTAIINSASPFYPVGAGLIGLFTYGMNGNDGRPANYLMASGPGGGPLFQCAPGAVFGSIESFNAVTMFANPVTGQAKIVDFIKMGGTAAVGHAFEPASDAIEQDEYLFRNLHRDDNGDGVGDLTLAEAMFSSLPYVSWAEVVIGDPLMRLRTGPGGIAELSDPPGDTDGDGYVGFLDIVAVLDGYGANIGDPLYHPGYDLDHNGQVAYPDAEIIESVYGTDYE
jgi:hypothetical protein